MNSAKRFGGAALIGLGGLTGLFCLRRRLRSEDQVVLAARSTGTEASFSGNTDSVPDTKSMSLKSVQVFFRHGARTPLRHIPGLEEVVYDKKFLIASVPYTEFPIEVQSLDGGARPTSSLQAHYEKTRFKGGVVAGMLTTVGKDQAYMLGKRLASRYGDLVGKEFNPEIVNVRSTNIDRCIESLQCVLAGMFGHISLQNRGPVLIQVTELVNEILIPSSYHCPSFRELAQKSQLALETDPDYLNIAERIQSHTGVKYNISDVDMMLVRDNIVARRAHGLLVPEFLEDLSPEIEKAAVTYLVSIICGNIKENPTLGLSFAIGRLLNTIKTSLQSSLSCQQGQQKRQPKLSLYSCHDSSLAPLLVVMGCFDDKWPPYAADIAIELYEDQAGKPWVKVNYCDKEMVLSGCKTPLITLDQYLAVIQPYILSGQQYEDHCKDVNKAVNHFKTIAKNQETTEIYMSPPNI